MNAFEEIWVFELEMTTSVSDEQPPNAYKPISLTDDGIVILVKDVQFEKALVSMLVTESGIMMFFRAVH